MTVHHYWILDFKISHHINVKSGKFLALLATMLRTALNCAWKSLSFTLKYTKKSKTLHWKLSEIWWYIFWHYEQFNSLHKLSMLSKKSPKFTLRYIQILLVQTGNAIWLSTVVMNANNVEFVTWLNPFRNSNW